MADTTSCIGFVGGDMWGLFLVCVHDKCCCMRLAHIYMCLLPKENGITAYTHPTQVCTQSRAPPTRAHTGVQVLLVALLATLCE